MIEGVQESIKLNAILENYDDKALNGLYTDVFTTDKGKLVLQDIANRCFVYTPSIDMDGRAEGMRSVFLSIQTRLRNTIEKRKEGN